MYVFCLHVHSQLWPTILQSHFLLLLIRRRASATVLGFTALLRDWVIHTFFSKSVVDIRCEELAWLVIFLSSTDEKVAWINLWFTHHDSPVQRSCSNSSIHLARCQFLYLIYKRTNYTYLSISHLILKTIHQISLPFICAQHRRPTSVTCLTTWEGLQAAHASKIHSDSMEKCWFSVNNCIRLSSALLTRATGCEDWKLVGRSISLDCFQLQTFCSLRTFHKVMRHPYTTGIYNSNYSKSWIIVIVEF